MKQANIVVMVNFEQAIETINFDYDKTISLTANITDVLSENYRVEYPKFERVTIQRCNENNVKMFMFKDDENNVYTGKLTK